MNVTILVDNTALFDRFFTAEHGFSAYIEAEGCRVLFDTGYSDAVLKNAQKMRIDLLGLDYIVLSHGHLDHTGGLYHLIRLFTEAILEHTSCHLPRLIAHPCCFHPRPKPPLPDSGQSSPQTRCRGSCRSIFQKTRSISRQICSSSERSRGSSPLRRPCLGHGAS